MRTGGLRWHTDWVNPSSAPRWPTLIRGLLNPDAYPHPVSALRVIETHISWIVLTGDFAYKIKKPVKLPFLDFSSLAKRLEACREELRLNRRLAPELYLDVVPISGDAARPRLGQHGKPFEYAVRMTQFPQPVQADRLLAAGKLGIDELRAFGRRLAQFHQAAPSDRSIDGYGARERIYRWVLDTLRGLKTAGLEPDDQRRTEYLRQWCTAQHRHLAVWLEHRRVEGFVREGHGDLHLANLVRLGQRITAFDCIEFEPALRWIDVINDAAFLFMDLCFRDRRDLAYGFLNAYLEASGDYCGVHVLRYYTVYRALVRAHVSLLQGRSISSDAGQTGHQQTHRYLKLAQRISEQRRGALVLMHGLSGSGKTQLSELLLQRLPAVRLRSDIERKRLQGLAAGDRSNSAIDSGIYTPQATARTYRHLLERAIDIAESGHTVILDAAFLHREQRAMFFFVADQRNFPLLIVDCQAPEEILERRLLERAASRHDASEADVAVLKRQLTVAEPLNELERTNSLPVDTTRAIPIDWVDRLRERIWPTTSA